MPTKFLISAVNQGELFKGDIGAILPEGADFGNREGPPNWVRVTVPDATRDQVVDYTQGWTLDFDHTIVQQNVNGWRIRIEVAPEYINASDAGRSEIKQEMSDYIENAEPGSLWDGASVRTFSSNSMTLDVPKSGQFQTEKGLTDVEYLKALRDDFSDQFKTSFLPRRYYFNDVDVDAAILLGGDLIRTAVQMLALVQDRLND